MNKLQQLYRLIDENNEVVCFGVIPFAGKDFIKELQKDIQKRNIVIDKNIKRYDFALTEQNIKDFDGTLPKDSNNWIPFNENGLNSLSLLPGHENLLKHYGYTIKNNYVHNLFGYQQFMVNIYWDSFEKENKECEKNGFTLYGFIRKIAEEDRLLREKNTIFDKRKIWVMTGRFGTNVQLLRFITETGPNFDKEKAEKDYFNFLQEEANKNKNPLLCPNEVKLLDVYELESSKFSYMCDIILKLEELFQVSEPTSNDNEIVNNIAQEIYDKMESVMKIAYS